jgi:hypothetical protein
MDYSHQDLPIIVEFPAGSLRPYKGGEKTMHYDYGYISGATGADGEDVDVYVGPDDNADFVYVIHQMKQPDFETYDEDKVMLGFSDETSARDAYLIHYNDDRFYGGMSAMPISQFKDQLYNGEKITHAPVEAMMRIASDKDKAISVGTDDALASPETVSVTDEDVPHPVDDNVPTRTAAVEFDRQETLDKGQKVTQLSTGRPAKVVSVGQFTATVEFTDGLRPGVRNVWLGDLTGKKTASKSDLKSALREFIASAVEEQRAPGELLTAETTAQLEQYFDKYIESKADEVLQYMRRERSGDMRHMMATNKPLKEQVTAILTDPDLRETVKDGFWNGFIHGAAEGWMGYQFVPPSLLTRIMLELTQRAEEGRMTEQDAVGLCIIQKELGDCFNQVNKPVVKSAAVDSYDALADGLDVALGFKEAAVEHEHGAAMRFGHEKEAAEELPFDVFGDDSSGDYSASERNLATLTVEGLLEERPRLLANRGELLLKGSKAFSKALRNLDNAYSIDEVSLQKIEAKRIADYSGVMVEGSLIWHARFASHAHRRRAMVQLIMPVIAGEPQPMVEVVTSLGQRVAFTSQALDEVMHVRRGNTQLGKGYTSVVRSFIPEK